jgi:glycosyltransferase involved in cell wall biosynthesis
VSFTDLPAIYRQASLFVYPSEFEGFGIPVVEALHTEVPVIAATGSCLEEAGGPGSVYIDPKDASELAAKANEILENDSLRTQMVQAGKKHLQNFADERIAAQMMEIYRSLV